MRTHLKSSVPTGILLAAALGLFCSVQAASAAPNVKTFATAKDAAEAYTAACEQQDTAALAAILGPDGNELINSGDEVQDRRRRERFAAMAKEGLDVRPDPVETGRFLMYVGKQEWPLPIPIVQTKDGFEFDASAGKAEILVRRVGRNELSAIEFLREFVNAELEFAYGDANQNEVRDYAQHIRSNPGKHDGLYWEAAEGQPGGPLGEFMARAQGEGYEVPETDQPFTYRGYVFRILQGQGPNASDGARDYIVRGDMIGGFAMVAYPAEYGASGVKTFVVNQTGVVYERDLGEKTRTIGATMKAYNPGKNWAPSPREEPGDEQAAPAKP